MTIEGRTQRALLAKLEAIAVENDFDPELPFNLDDLGTVDGALDTEIGESGLWPFFETGYRWRTVESSYPGDAIVFLEAHAGLIAAQCQETNQLAQLRLFLGIVDEATVPSEIVVISHNGPTVPAMADDLIIRLKAALVAKLNDIAEEEGYDPGAVFSIGPLDDVDLAFEDGIEEAGEWLNPPDGFRWPSIETMHGEHGEWEISLSTHANAIVEYCRMSGQLPQLARYLGVQTAEPAVNYESLVAAMLARLNAARLDTGIDEIEWYEYDDLESIDARAETLAGNLFPFMLPEHSGCKWPGLGYFYHNEDYPVSLEVHARNVVDFAVNYHNPEYVAAFKKLLVGNSSDIVIQEVKSYNDFWFQS